MPAVLQVFGAQGGTAEIASITDALTAGSVVLRSTTATIASGAITITAEASVITVDGESAAADDLDTITGGAEGQLLVIRQANAARNITLTAAGNILPPRGERVELDAANDSALLCYDGTNWQVLGYLSALMSGDAVYKKSGVIADTAVQGMNGTPVSVIAAPGAGRYIEVLSCAWFLDFGGVAYDAAAAGDTLELKYTDGSGAAVVDAVAGNAIGAASADYHTVVKAVAEVVPVANAAIVAHINTGEWYVAAGNSPLKYEILYRIRTLLT